MPDINKEAMAFWNAIKPAIDEEIKKQTKGMVQRRRMKVTTAPSLSTNAIGVTEPFGTEIFLPFTTNVINATVGDGVWVEYVYGATNSIVISMASGDEKDWYVSGDLHVVGNSSFGGSVSGISASDVGAVPQAGSNGFLFRRTGNVSEKELCKTLWSDSTGWSTGSITVSGITNYSLFIVKCSDGLCNIICSFSSDGTNTYFRGDGGYPNGSSQETNYYMSATVSSETLTLEYCRSVKGSSQRTSLSVTEIIGII